jgi:hypothetical protein
MGPLTSGLFLLATVTKAVFLSDLAGRWQTRQLRPPSPCRRYDKSERRCYRPRQEQKKHCWNKKPSTLLLATRPGRCPQFTMSLGRWKVAKPLTTGAISALWKTKTTPDIVAIVDAKVKEHRCVTCKNITTVYGGVQWVIVQACMAANKIQLLQQPLYLLDLASTNYFLLWRVKEELVGVALTGESLKKTWEGVQWNTGIHEIAISFRQ